MKIQMKMMSFRNAHDAEKMTMVTQSGVAENATAYIAKTAIQIMETARIAEVTSLKKSAISTTNRRENFPKLKLGKFFKSYKYTRFS